MLSVEQLYVNYGEKEILHDVDLQVAQEEIVMIVGESGSGKSTLVRSIMGLLGEEGHITKGNIVVGNNCYTDALNAGGDITIGDDSVIRGGIKCNGSVKVGEYASTVWIFGDVGVDIGKESEATSIQTFGDLKLGTKAIAFECCSTEKFECGDGAIVQNIFSGNELKIGKNCQIEDEILVKNI